jgi:5-methylcytosine-specific restriction protein A
MPNSAPVHRPIGIKPWADRKREYVENRASLSRIYGRRWQKLRAAYLAQHPVCECGCNRVAEVVHHIKPHRGDDALLYDWANLQALTKKCHDSITVRQGGGFGNPVKT